MIRRDDGSSAHPRPGAGARAGGEPAAAAATAAAAAAAAAASASAVFEVEDYTTVSPLERLVHVVEEALRSMCARAHPVRAATRTLHTAGTTLTLQLLTAGEAHGDAIDATGGVQALCDHACALWAKRAERAGDGDASAHGAAAASASSAPESRGKPHNVLHMLRIRACVELKSEASARDDSTAALLLSALSMAADHVGCLLPLVVQRRHGWVGRSVCGATFSVDTADGIPRSVRTPKDLALLVAAKLHLSPVQASRVLVPRLAVTFRAPPPSPDLAPVSLRCEWVGCDAVRGALQVGHDPDLASHFSCLEAETWRLDVQVGSNVVLPHALRLHALLAMSRRAADVSSWPSVIDSELDSEAQHAVASSLSDASTPSSAQRVRPLREFDDDAAGDSTATGDDDDSNDDGNDDDDDDDGSDGGDWAATGSTGNGGRATIKGAPVWSSLSRFSYVAADLPSVHSFARAWSLFVHEVESCWLRLVPIPWVVRRGAARNDAAGAQSEAHGVSLQWCRVFQNLEVVNSCVLLRRARQSRANEPSDDESSGASSAHKRRAAPSRANAQDEDDDDPWAWRDESSASANDEGGDDDDNDDNDDDEFTDAQEVPAPRGVLRVLAGMVSDVTGQPLNEPRCFPSPPWTEDDWRAHQELIASMGTSESASEERAEMQSDILFSDMQSFKAANPGCSLADFVRWHSPRDWSPSGLSQRMRTASRWHDLWARARARTAAEQDELWSPETLAARALDRLRHMSASDVLSELFLVAVQRGMSELRRAQADTFAPVAMDELVRRLQTMRGPSEDGASHCEAFVHFFQALEQMLSAAAALERAGLPLALVRSLAGSGGVRTNFDDAERRVLWQRLALGRGEFAGVEQHAVWCAPALARAASADAGGGASARSASDGEDACAPLVARLYCRGERDGESTLALTLVDTRLLYTSHL